MANVLEGSVRKAGNRVRISVQLIDVADGNNLWSERYDREMTDVFEIQDEISQAIVGKLRVKLASHSGSDATSVAGRPHRSSATRRIWKPTTFICTGRFELVQDDARGTGCQQDSCSRKRSGSIRTMRWRMTGWRIAGIRKASSASWRRKRRCRRRRRQCGGRSSWMRRVAEAHATLGVILALYDWDWAGAEREMMRSIELNGSSPVSRDVYAFYYLRPVGRIEEAVRKTQQALSLDPLSILFRVHLGFLYYLQRQVRAFDRAVPQGAGDESAVLSGARHDGAGLHAGGAVR